MGRLPSISASASPITKDFVDYLRRDFRSGKDWKHPSTNKLYEHSLIKDVLEQYKSMYAKNYAALFCLWLEIPRKDVAESLMVSPSTLKRRWEQAIEDLLFLLLFPTLVPEDLKIYEDSPY